MQSQLITDLMSVVNANIFELVIQMLVIGAILLWIKDMTGRIVTYYNLRMSNFGRGTKIIVEGHEGFIYHVGFSQVEINLDDPDTNSTLLMPSDRFAKASKIIVVNNVVKKK